MPLRTWRRRTFECTAVLESPFHRRNHSLAHFSNANGTGRSQSSCLDARRDSRSRHRRTRQESQAFATALRSKNSQSGIVCKIPRRVAKQSARFKRQAFAATQQSSRTDRQSSSSGQCGRRRIALHHRRRTGGGAGHTEFTAAKHVHCFRNTISNSCNVKTCENFHNETGPHYVTSGPSTTNEDAVSQREEARTRRQQFF